SAGGMGITIGRQAGRLAAAPLPGKGVAARAIFAWSGPSGHAQVAVMGQRTGLRLGPYIAARCLHALLAAGFTWLILGPLQGWVDVGALPVLAPWWAAQSLTFGARLFHATATAAQLALGMLGVVGVGAALGRLAVFWTRVR